MDETGKINRLEDTALKFAKMAGIDLKLGGTMSEADKEKFTAVLCDSLFEAAFPFGQPKSGSVPRSSARRSTRCR
jgi:hypothetical protein